MGLMNVGKSEGSEIIQLFGRGVRLKGLDMSLKRSAKIGGITRPDQIGRLETLNIFGIRAQYMQQFKEYLEDEGLPANEDRVEFILPVVKNLNGKKLKSIRLKDDVDFKRDGPKPLLDEPTEYLITNPLTVNWYPKIQSQQSRGLARAEETANLGQGRLEGRHLAFMDMDRIYFQLQQFKNERAWFNFNLPRASISTLLDRPNRYTLYIPAAELEFTRFDRVRHWEEIAIALLKKYCDRLYKHRRQEWEAEHLEYHELTEDDPNFISEYRLMIEQSANDIAAKLDELKKIITSRQFSDWSFGNLEALCFGQHLYQPLLHIKSDLVETMPVSLNDGERDFVCDLRRFFNEKPDFFQNREMYLLRNMSRGRGIGFFEAGNFYPDFILWLLMDNKQYVSFVDPKGLRNLEGLDDPKIRFHRTIKELENRLADANVILNSFIISNTPSQGVSWWSSNAKSDLEKRHVLFQDEDNATYIEKMLKMVVGSG